MAHTDQSRSPTSVTAGAKALLAWGILRAPLILVILFLSRETISTLQVFDGEALTVRIIDLMSLPASRGMLFLLFAAMFGGLVIILRRWFPAREYLILLGAVALTTVILFEITQTPLRHAAIPVILAATNFLPAAFLQRHLNGRILAVGVGFTEALAIRRHISWLAGLANWSAAAQRVCGILGWGLAVSLVSASMVALIKGERLVPVEQALRTPNTVGIIMKGSINGLSLEPISRRLYVTGHGLENIVEVDIDTPGKASRTSEVVSGGAQGIFLDAQAGELSVFNGDTKQLLFIDAETLSLNRSIDVKLLASGDPWISFDPISDTIALVSEADLDDGVAFVLLDHATGDVLDTRELDAGNILKHPEKPLLYLSFFRRNPEVLIYDMTKRDIIARSPAPARLDRMILMPAANELLVTSPVKSEILRLDADTLATKGAIKGPFGVRTLAVDNERQLLFAGSFVTGQVRVIDTNTWRNVETVYLGPWLRSIELDVATGTAYVSSNGALYSWAYDQDR